MRAPRSAPQARSRRMCHTHFGLRSTSSSPRFGQAARNTLAHVEAMRSAGVARISPRIALLSLASSALVAPPADASSVFEAALAVPEASRWSFEFHRVQLLYGEHLRRSRAAKEAHVLPSRSRGHVSPTWGGAMGEAGCPRNASQWHLPLSVVGTGRRGVDATGVRDRDARRVWLHQQGNRAEAVHVASNRGQPPVSHLPETRGSRPAPRFRHARVAPARVALVIAADRRA